MQIGTKRPRELTGRMVLAYVLAFFGVVFAANALLVRAATSTFGGLETDSSYKAGLTFKAEEDAVRAQDARGWRVAGHITHAADGNVALAIGVVDRTGAAPEHLEATARLVHPTDARFDRSMPLDEVAPGRFRGVAAPGHGQWDLVLALTRGADVMFRSKNRIVLH